MGRDRPVRWSTGLKLLLRTLPTSHRCRFPFRGVSSQHDSHVKSPRYRSAGQRVGWCNHQNRGERLQCPLIRSAACLRLVSRGPTVWTSPAAVRCSRQRFLLTAVLARPPPQSPSRRESWAVGNTDQRTIFAAQGRLARGRGAATAGEANGWGRGRGRGFNATDHGGFPSPKRGRRQSWAASRTFSGRPVDPAQTQDAEG